MYYILKEKGLLKDIDENMGIEFFDIDKIMARKRSFETSEPGSSSVSVGSNSQKHESNEVLLNKIR